MHSKRGAKLPAQKLDIGIFKRFGRTCQSQTSHTLKGSHSHYHSEIGTATGHPQSCQAARSHRHRKAEAVSGGLSEKSSSRQRHCKRPPRRFSDKNAATRRLQPAAVFSLKCSKSKSWKGLPKVIFKTQAWISVVAATVSQLTFACPGPC